MKSFNPLLVMCWLFNHYVCFPFNRSNARASAQFPRRMMSQMLLTAWSTDCWEASRLPFPLPFFLFAIRHFPSLIRFTTILVNMSFCFGSLSAIISVMATRALSAMCRKPSAR